MHPGLDPIGLGRAVYRNTLTGRSEGASTITQQLARTLFLSNRKSYTRKFREAVISVQLELQLTKAQILELYLNRIYLSAGVYGVEPMARRVFGKPAESLTLAESAFIAGLARAPGGAVAVVQLPRAPSSAATWCWRACGEAGFITEADERAARRARLRVRPYQPTSTASDAYARAYVRQLFRDTLGGDHPPDWRVDTTIVAPACRRPPTASCGRGSADSASASCRRRSWRWIRPPATCWRWLAGATRRSSPSTARRAAAVSPARPSSRCCSRRRSSRASRP